MLLNEIDDIDFIEPMRLCTVDILYHEDDGIIMLEKESQSMMISMNDMNKLKTLFSVLHLENYDLYNVKQKEIVDLLMTDYHKKDYFACYQAVYPYQQLLDLAIPQDVSIQQLTLTYLDDVNEIYHHMDDKDYLKERIEQKAMWGLFVDDELAGFIGMHREGSMGILEIKKAYQRHGYGYLLEGYLINELLKQKKVPYCQVIEGNEASLALQRKLHMKISSRYSYWVFDD